MDQDFHYYGTYAAARMGGWNPDDATLIAKAANFVDFFNQATYRGYWVYKRDKYELGMLEYPRYTFDQEDHVLGLPCGAMGTWAAFHFLPGNFEPTRTLRYPRANLPGLVKRKMTEGEWVPRGRHRASRNTYDWRLTRPLSPLSRCLVQDTIELATSDAEVNKVLGYAPGLEYFHFENGEQAVRDKFRKILMGVRAHVIADTWAHQDFAAASHNINTYWDIHSSTKGTFHNRTGTYGIRVNVNDGQGYYNTVLGRKEKRPFIEHGMGALGASPVVAGGVLGKLGHGWMGHLPDHSFVSYQYRPFWKNKRVHTRENIKVYMDALYDLRHMMAECRSPTPVGLGPMPQDLEDGLHIVLSTCWADVEESIAPRIFCGDAWVDYLNDRGGAPTKLDMTKEPCDATVLFGGLKSQRHLSHKKGTRPGYGTFTLEIEDGNKDIIDFYLFQLAADYHFQYVKEWLLEYGRVGTSTKLVNNRPSFGKWGDKPGPLGGGVTHLAARRVALRQR